MGADTPAAGKVFGDRSASTPMTPRSSDRAQGAAQTREEQFSMVDQESGELPAPARLHRIRVRSGRRQGVGVRRRVRARPIAADPGAGDPAPRFPTLGPLLDDDQPKPLYRDEVAPAAAPRGADREPRRGLTRPPSGPITFAPRPRPPSTTSDHRSCPGPERPARADILDGRPSTTSTTNEQQARATARTRLALLIGAVAAVIVIGLAVGYAVIGIGQEPAGQPRPDGDHRRSAPGSTQEPSPGTASTGAADRRVDAESPIRPKRLDSKRTWKVEPTQRGPSEDTPVPACFGGDPVEGEPSAETESPSC